MVMMISHGSATMTNQVHNGVMRIDWAMDPAGWITTRTLSSNTLPFHRKNKRPSKRVL
jgi:hypothetical protein